jgi:hypothetical protein
MRASPLPGPLSKLGPRRHADYAPTSLALLPESANCCTITGNPGIFLPDAGFANLPADQPRVLRELIDHA